MPLPSLGEGFRLFAFAESNRNYDWARLARWIQLHASVVVRQRAERQREESRAAQLRALSRVSSFLDRSSGGYRVLLETLAETRRALEASAVWLQFPKATAGEESGVPSLVVGRSVVPVEQRLHELAAMRRSGLSVSSRQVRSKKGEERRVLLRSLEYGGAVQGVLGVEWPVQARVSAEPFVSELAAQLSLLLRDVEEVEQVRRRHRELVITNRVGSLATQLEDSAHAVQKALTLFVDASGYTGAVLYQISEDGQALDFVTTAGRWTRKPRARILLPENLDELNRDKKVRRALGVSPRGVVIPLRAYGRLVGTLAVETRQPQLVLVGQAGLDTVARELALALENARLVQRLNKTLQLQTTLLRLSSALLDARDLGSIVEAIGRAVSELYPSCWLGMAVRSERSGLMVPYGKFWKNGNVIWSGETLSGHKRLQSWNRRLKGAENDVSPEGAHLVAGRAAASLKSAWQKPPRASQIWVVPCRVYGQTQAYMLFGLPEGLRPSAQQVRNMLVGARHAAMAINAALDLQRHQVEAERAALLAELGRLMGANIDAQELSQRALLALKRILPYDLASVTAVDLRKKTLQVVAIEGSKPLTTRPGDVFNAGDSFLGRVVRSRRPRIIHNLRLKRRRSRVDERILAYGVRSAINVPLIAQDRVFGSLNLGSFQESYFTERDLPFLNEVAAQLSLAIANRRLFEDLSANLAFSRRLLRTWRFFSAEENAEKLVRYAMLQAMRAFDGVGAFWVRERAGRRCVRHVGLVKRGIREADILAAVEAAQKEGICRTTTIDASGETLHACLATISVPTVGSRNTLAVLFSDKLPVGEAGAQNFLWTLASQLVAAVERARFVNTLRKSEENYRALFQNLPVGLVLVDEDGVIRLVNRQGAELLGLSIQELESGHRFAEFVAAEELAEWATGSPAEAGTDGSMTELNLVRADGRRLRVRATRQEMRDPFRGQLIGLIDITAQRELEKRAAEAEKLAAVGELAAAIAHEIRNPLAAITTSVSTLGDALDVSGEDRELMEIVLEESRRVSRVLDDFLRFARLPRPRKEPSDLNALVHDVLRLYRLEVPQNVRVETALYEALPQVPVDGQLLKHVVVNLLQNAVDAVKEKAAGLVRVSSGVYTGEEGQRQVWIAVADNGPGIPEEARKKVFQPFFTTKSTGVGMGLPISDGIVRAHGGRMELRSRPGEGTEVRVYLPLRDQEEEGAASEEKARLGETWWPRNRFR
ncbi:MAG: GAF domain-containing protein [Calditrichaeota bacterium]|nr:GAF domain-containing protein [Calditrichota bacterium]